MAALVTFESVAQAAQDLLADGEKASVRNVMKRLGGGSPNSVLQFVNEWKSGRPVVRASDIELDASIGASIVRQMQQVAAAASAAAEEKASALSDDLATLAESNQSLEQRVEQLTGELATSATTIEQLTSQQHDSDLRHQSEIDTLKSKLVELTTDLEKERDRANASQQELGKAQAKAEAVPRLEQQIADLRGALESERTARAAAEQRAAVADMQSRGAAESNDLLRAELVSVRQDARDVREEKQRDIESLRIEVREAAQKLDQARQQIDTLHEQLAAARKNTTINPSKQEA